MYIVTLSQIGRKNPGKQPPQRCYRFGPGGCDRTKRLPTSSFLTKIVLLAKA